MSLIRWQPFREIDELQREMNRFFDVLMPKESIDNGEKAGWNFVPSAELIDTPEAVNLKLEVPGIDPKDIEIEPTFRRLVSKVNNIFGKRNRGKTEYVDVQGLS